VSLCSCLTTYSRTGPQSPPTHTVLLTPSYRDGDGTGLPEFLRGQLAALPTPHAGPGTLDFGLWTILQNCNRTLGCLKPANHFYEGLVAKRCDSPYPLQRRSADQDFPFWMKHRWAFSFMKPTKTNTLAQRLKALGYAYADPWSNAGRSAATKDGQLQTFGDILTDLLDRLDRRDQRPQVLLIMDGGIIHEIIGDCPVDVTILDYDTDGATDDDVLKLPREGYGERCYHIARSTDVAPAEIAATETAITEYLRRWRNKK
jgi:hypothetical protein